jgi:hypothetical protein
MEGRGQAETRSESLRLPQGGGQLRGSTSVQDNRGEVQRGQECGLSSA